MGPLSQEALGQRLYRLQILIIWGPYEPPALKTSHGTPKNPKKAGAWCDIGTRGPASGLARELAFFLKAAL